MCVRDVEILFEELLRHAPVAARTSAKPRCESICPGRAPFIRADATAKVRGVVPDDRISGKFSAIKICRSFAVTFALGLKRNFAVLEPRSEEHTSELQPRF